MTQYGTHIKRKLAARIATKVYRSSAAAERRQINDPQLSHKCIDSGSWKACLAYGWYVARNIVDYFKMSGTEIETLLGENSGDLCQFYDAIDEEFRKRIGENNENHIKKPMISNYRIYKPYNKI